VTRYTYEPIFNQIWTIADARELTPGFQASIGAVTSGRYTTRIFYDYQEGSAPVAEATKFGIDLSSVARGARRPQW